MYDEVVTGLAEVFPQLVTSLLLLEKEEGVAPPRDAPPLR